MSPPGPFISYAQNFEDVMLWRALRHVARGFYIDAGASLPESDSVTCAFYIRGWNGINIEPAPTAFAALDAARPRDINLNVAVGAATGDAQFLLIDGGNGLSTLQHERLEALQQAGWPIEIIQVRVLRLADICRDHVTRHIHFLKVDVEGFERAVLEGAELETWRPWIIVIESTRPNTQTTTHAEWEDLLLAARYRMVYWDGLNRFYLAAEHEDLASAFTAPPNVFDQFVRQPDWQGRIDAATLNQQVLRLDAELRQANATVTALQGELIQLAALREHAANTLAERDDALQELWESNRVLAYLATERQKLLDQIATKTDIARTAAEAELHAVYESTSWRLTAPVRLVKRLRSP